jgi:hypothetical protein
MTMRTHWIAVVSSIFVCGCACEPTPYQRAATHSGKGYSERRVSEDTFYVQYVATTATPHQVLSGYLYRRAAELTLQYGFRYFVVLRAPRRRTSLDARAVPVQDEPSKWGTVVVQAPSPGTLLMPIQCLHDTRESPGMSLIDAKEYLDRRVDRILLPRPTREAP